MRFIDANPILFVISGLLVFAVAAFEIMTRQLGGSKAVEALISDVWQDLRPRLSLRLLWLLLIPVVLLLMSRIPGSN